MWNHGKGLLFQGPYYKLSQRLVYVVWFVSKVTWLLMHKWPSYTPQTCTTDHYACHHAYIVNTHTTMPLYYICHHYACCIHAYCQHAYYHYACHHYAWLHYGCCHHASLSKNWSPQSYKHIKRCIYHCIFCGKVVKTWGTGFDIST